MFRKGSDNMNRRILTALILNILVVIATTAITVSYYFHSNNPLVETGLDSYKFFTTDSNILAAISALVMIPYEIGILRGKRDKLPHAAVVLKFVGMVAVMLTFLTVIFLLLPVYDAGFLLLVGRRGRIKDGFRLYVSSLHLRRSLPPPTLPGTGRRTLLPWEII